MADDEDDLDEEQAEFQKEIQAELDELRKRLKLLLAPKVEEQDADAIKSDLHNWLGDADWGSDYEARRLLAFIRVYAPFVDYVDTNENKTHDSRTLLGAMKRDGLTDCIEGHFLHLFLRQHAPTGPSVELLRWGLFGPREKTRHGNRAARINKAVELDAWELAKRGQRLSKVKLAAYFGVSRRAIDKDLKTVPDFDDRVETVAQGLRYTIDRRRGED